MPCITIEIGNKTVADVEVTIVDENIYRIEEEPLFFFDAEDEDQIDSFPRYGDSVLTERIDDSTVRFVAVHERGPYRHYDFLLQDTVVGSQRLHDFLALVIEEGGHWERYMGGYLLLSIPEHSPLDPDHALAKIHDGA